MVTVTVPKDKVFYNYSAVVTCTTVEDLKLDPTWTLRRDGLNFDITNGTVSTLKTKSSTEFQIDLKNVDKHWTGETCQSVKLTCWRCLWFRSRPQLKPKCLPAWSRWPSRCLFSGEYDCSFTKSNSNISVTYKANATIDICLKPDIINSVEPAFPLCTRKDQLLFVTVTCQIMKSSESYNVTWPADYRINPTTNGRHSLLHIWASLNVFFFMSDSLLQIQTRWRILLRS